MRSRIDGELDLIREVAANHNEEQQQVQQNHALQALQRQYQQRQEMMAAQSYSRNNNNMEVGMLECNNGRARSMYYLAKAARDQLLIDKYAHAAEEMGENDVAFFPEPGSHVIIDEEYMAYEQQQQDDGWPWIHDNTAGQ